MKIEYVEPLLKSDIERIVSQTITLKDFIELEPKIIDRVYYVYEFIGKITGFEINYLTLSNGYMENFGFFDPREYSETISLSGSFSESDDSCLLYEGEFPTRFLHEEFEEEVKQEVADYLQKFKDC